MKRWLGVYGGVLMMILFGFILLIFAVLIRPTQAQANTKQSVKEFSIAVSETEHELYPGGPKVMAWAFNGQVPGPVIRVTEGDLVKIHFTNKHEKPHTLHFHGLNVPNEMDGVAYGHLDHLEVQPGKTHTYEFIATPAGTHIYHCHVNSPHHIDMGMYGAFIVEPKPITKEYIFILDEWYINEHGDQEAMAHPGMINWANYFTVNGKAFPATEQVKLTKGERARIRFINMGYQPHSMHLHGNSFVVTHKDGRPVPQPQEQDTIFIGPGERYDIVVTGDNSGLWLFHCHIVPHASNDGEYPGGMLIPVITEMEEPPAESHHK